MNHFFDPDIAGKYGVNEAIILNNIAYWVDKNKKNEHNFFEGRYWTYNSAKAFKDQFPYMSVRTIQRVLKHLIDEGLILSGKFNSDTRNRTNYYTLTDYGLSITLNWRVALCQNGNIGGDKVAECIFKNSTDSNTDINNTVINIPPISPVEELFNQFWQVYPRKASKKDAFKAFKAIKNIEKLLPDILSDIEIKRKSESWTKDKGQFIPYPATYLRGERWNDSNDMIQREQIASSILKNRLGNYF